MVLRNNEESDGKKESVLMKSNRYQTSAETGTKLSGVLPGGSVLAVTGLELHTVVWPPVRRNGEEYDMELIP